MQGDTVLGRLAGRLGGVACADIASPILTSFWIVCHGECQRVHLYSLFYEQYKASQRGWSKLETRHL